MIEKGCRKPCCQEIKHERRYTWLHNILPCLPYTHRDPWHNIFSERLVKLRPCCSHSAFLSHRLYYHDYLRGELSHYPNILRQGFLQPRSCISSPCYGEPRHNRPCITAYIFTLSV